MFQNGQTQFKSHAANAAIFLKYIIPLQDVMGIKRLNDDGKDERKMTEKCIANALKMH